MQSGTHIKSINLQSFSCKIKQYIILKPYYVDIEYIIKYEIFAEILKFNFLYTFSHYQTAKQVSNVFVFQKYRNLSNGLRNNSHYIYFELRKIC